ncbi:MAG TPA: PKD domain-containing protein [Bacteroidia bacterium]|nr:PKD domain-containing protein [Bacteroidia bacterium]
MRRIQFLYYLLFILVEIPAAKAAAPPILEWQKCLGGSSQDMPVRLIKGNDNYIYTLGSTGSNDGDVAINKGSLDLWVTKQDSLGNLIWEKSYGGSNMDVGTGIIQLASGGFILSGYTSSTNGDVIGNHGNFDAWVLEIDPLGNIIWQKTIGGSQVDLSYTIEITQDGGYIIGGGTYSNDGDVSGNHGDQDFWLVKLSAQGTIQWQRALGGSGLDVCYSVKETDNGEIIACGSSNSTDGNVTHNNGNYDFWVTKLSQTGNLLWAKCFGGSQAESAMAMDINSAGQFVISGYSRSADGDVTMNHGYNDFWVCIVNTNGNLITQKSFGGSGADIAYSLIYTSDGGYLVSGGTTSSDHDVLSNKGAEDVLLLKLDAGLNIEWSKAYGGAGNDRPSCTIQNTDGGFYVAAYTYSTDGDITGNHGTSDFWILKLSCKVPQSAFLSSTDSVCTNGRVELTNLSTWSGASSWYVNNIYVSNLPDPSLNLTRNGTNIITLISETCYNSDQVQASVYVSRPPIVDIILGEPYLCTGSSIELSSNSQGLKLWSNGSSQELISVSRGGWYELSVTKGGCTRSGSIFVTEHTLPAFTLGNDTSICQGSTLLLTVPANMQSYVWQDGSTNNNYLVTLDGTYRVTVRDQYCAAEDEITVSMLNCGAPIANFSSSAQEICENQDVSFFDLSSNADNWSWTFPGGSPAFSSLQNPVISYSTPGTYAVMLQATNQMGSHHVMRVQYIVVHANPVKPTINVTGNHLTSTQAENYQWKFNQSIIPGAIYQSYTALQSGSYKVEISDDNQCHAESDPVTVLITGLSSIRATGAGLTVFPNPTYGEVHLRSDLSETEDAELRIFDNKASLIYSSRINQSQEGNVTTLDLSALPGGTYFLEYRTMSGQVTGSILLKQ